MTSIVTFNGKHGHRTYLYSEEEWPRICMMEFRHRQDIGYIPKEIEHHVRPKPEKPEPLPELKSGTHPDWVVEKHARMEARWRADMRAWRQDMTDWAIIQSAMGGDLTAAVNVIESRASAEHEEYEIQHLMEVSPDIPRFKWAPHVQVYNITMAYREWKADPSKKNEEQLRAVIKDSEAQGEPFPIELEIPEGRPGRWAKDAQRLRHNLLRLLDTPEDEKLQDRSSRWLQTWGWPGC